MDICLGYVTDFWANIPPIFALIIFVTNFWHLLPMLGFTGSLRIEAAEETDQVLVHHLHHPHLSYCSLNLILIV